MYNQFRRASRCGRFFFALGFMKIWLSAETFFQNSCQIGVQSLRVFSIDQIAGGPSRVITWRGPVASPPAVESASTQRTEHVRDDFGLVVSLSPPPRLADQWRPAC